MAEDSYNAGNEQDAIPKISSDDDTAKYVNELFRKGLKTARNQHDQVRWARNFTEGTGQWDPQDEAKLKAENRPVGVFNFTKRTINVVSGVEILNRLQPVFLARVLDNDLAAQLAELDTGVHEYVMEACDGHYEKSLAFRACVNEGIGALKGRLDLVDSMEPGGQWIWENTDSCHLVWDPDANSRQNLKGARYVIYFAKIPTLEACNEWPDEAEYIKSSAPSDYDDQFGTSAKVEQIVPATYDPINKYETESIDSGGKNHVIVKEAYWYEDEDWVEYIDPFRPDEQDFKEMPRADWAKFKADFMAQFPDRAKTQPLKSLRKTKRIYKRAFIIGGRTMEESDAPLQTGFPIKFITGEWDEINKVYRGLPWLLKDPQQYLNRYLSNTAHAIATTPKGILLFEDGAFTNYVMAEEQWASWAPFIPMTEGAISGEKRKYEYIPPSQISPATFQMMDICMKVIEEIAGINVEMLGAGEGEVPGITMRQRQSVAMIAMAGFFNAYRRFLKAEAVMTLEAVREFYTDDRIIRIGGPYDSQAIQLFKDDLSYPTDVTIDEAPNNPNTRDAAFAAAAPILPGLFKSGAIMQIPSMIDIFPLIPKVRAELKQYLIKMGQQISQAGGTPGQRQPQNQGKGQGKQEDPRVSQGRVALMDAKKQETLVKARKLDSDAQMKVLSTFADTLVKMQQDKRTARESQMGHVETGHRIQRENRSAGISSLAEMMSAVGALTKSQRESSQNGNRNGASAGA